MPFWNYALNRLKKPTKHFLLFVAFSCICNTSLHAQIIITVAGTNLGYSGDGGPATQAQMNDMSGVAVDNAGNIFIAERANNVIRKVDNSGIITTFAGFGVPFGTPGYSGDGGIATSARLYLPAAVAVDEKGNVYVADQDGKKIRKVNSSGIITTIAGNGVAGNSGDGGPAISAWFNRINGITFDKQNNMYLSDGTGNVIRKINSSGVISTIAGVISSFPGGSAGFSGDGGPATSAGLNHPHQVAIDNAGNIYIPESENRRVRKIDLNGIITTIAGTGNFGSKGDGGLAISAELASPYGVAVDKSGNIYVADGRAFKIRKISTSGIISTYAGNGFYSYRADCVPATSTSLEVPVGVAIDKFDHLYIADNTFHYRIRKVKPYSASMFSAMINEQPINDTVCVSGDASFSVKADNVRKFQWQFKNFTDQYWASNFYDQNIYSGTNTATLSVKGISASTNKFEYRCVVTTECGTDTTSSARIIINDRSSTAEINIASSVNQTCEGTQVVFTSTITNGGNLPSFQWKKNNVNVGTDSNIYTDSTLKNGDMINCILTSNAECLLRLTDTSNAISIKINPVVTPVVSINTNSENICSGSKVTFFATTTNGGNQPQYQWKRNGINVGTNSSAYTDSSLLEGDKITCLVTSVESCTAQSISNEIVMKVQPLLTPTVTITSSDNNICPGSPVTFTATTVNGGNSPVFLWRKNGVTVGTNNSKYTDNALNNADVISCQITSNVRCVTAPVAESDEFVITVRQNLPKPVDLGQDRTICKGSKVSFNAGSEFASYLWQDGSTEPTFSTTASGTYSVRVKDICNNIYFDTVKVAYYREPLNFLPGDTAICSYNSIELRPLNTFSSYFWNNSASTSSIVVTTPGEYWLQVTDGNGCVGRDSINVRLKNCIEGVHIPNAFTPNGDGKNDVFKPLVYGLVKRFEFSIYNRLGQLIYKTDKPGSGWDGKINGNPQNSTFVWVCTYQLEGEPTRTQKGTVLIVR